MNIMLKSIQQSSETTHWLPCMTGQYAAKKHQDHLKQTLHDDPQKNSNKYLEKAEVKPELHSHQPFGHKTHSLESCMQ